MNAMSTAPRPRFTYRDYLDLEEASNVKHEFLAGEIYAIAGGTPEHAALAATVMGMLHEQLRGGPCRVFSSDLRVRVVETGLATYPDATIVCGDIQRDPESRTTAINPTVVIEVLSDRTEAYDRTEKLAHYQRIASLREIVLVSHPERLIEVWHRAGDEAWDRTEARVGRAAVLASVSCELQVAELYEQALRGDAPAD